MNKKKIIPFIIIAVILFFSGFLLGKVPIGNKKAVSETVPSAEDPSMQDPYNGLASYVTNTTPQMLSSEYWMREDSDQLLYTSDETAEFNANNPMFVLYDNSALGKEKKLFMENLPEELTNEMVASLLNQNILQNTESLYINGEIPNDSYWETLIANCALETVPESIAPVYAVCLNRVVAKILPSDDFASSDPEEIFCNDLVSAELMPCTGAVIIHESADGEWYYVIYGSICGWVRKEYLALCRDKEEWLQSCCPENYLMVTACELILDETPIETASSRMILPMGTKVRLTSDPPEQVNGRSTFGCYVVDIPCRDQNGFLTWENALISVNEDVHVGPLPMTSSAVVRQAFKFLGRIYGWGGSLSSNDCSGFVRQVYACFDYHLPRNATAIAEMTDLGCFNCSDMTKEKKLELLEQMPAGTLLYMKGHVMIYLGMENGAPYVISSCATYIDPEGDPDTIKDAYCIFVSGLDLLRTTGKTWLDSLMYMQWKLY